MVVAVILAFLDLQQESVAIAGGIVLLIMIAVQMVVNGVRSVLA